MVAGKPCESFYRTKIQLIKGKYYYTNEKNSSPVAFNIEVADEIFESFEDKKPTLEYLQAKFSKPSEEKK